MVKVGMIDLAEGKRKKEEARRKKEEAIEGNGFSDYECPNRARSLLDQVRWYPNSMGKYESR
jgi:hypothetical protein